MLEKVCIAACIADMWYRLNINHMQASYIRILGIFLFS